ncbi:MAG: hypothetical protein AB1567_05160 [bacterium]
MLVQEGATLTIEPEVVVKLKKDKALQINGELSVKGTRHRPNFKDGKLKGCGKI